MEGFVGNQTNCTRKLVLPLGISEVPDILWGCSGPKSCVGVELNLRVVGEEAGWRTMCRIRPDEGDDVIPGRELIGQVSNSGPRPSATRSGAEGSPLLDHCASNAPS